MQFAPTELIRQTAAMPVLIPERTIDSLFAFEFLTVAPTATIWSPHNNRGLGTVDHEVHTSRRYFEFECKTIYRDHVGARWEIKVPLTQLQRYLAAGKQNLVYLLPARPADETRPWDRGCRTDPDAGGNCRACASTSRHDGPVHFRRHAFLEPRIRLADPEVRLQPWFNHWAWCISARDLNRYIGAQSLRKDGDSLLIPADDAYLAGIAGTERLCHLFETVEDDYVRGFPFDGFQPRERFDDDNAVRLRDWTMPAPDDLVERGMIAETDDDEWRVQVWY